MQRMREKLIIVDYMQLVSYPERKKIVYFMKEHDYLKVEELLTDILTKHHLQEMVIEDLSDFDPLMQILVLTDENYPALLFETYDPPLVLYCKGNLELLQNDYLLGVVGSRNPKEYSENATKKIVSELAMQHRSQPMVIVSGLAKGIDAISHQVALQNNIPTIAVLGFGFQYMYPFENKHLLEEIIKKGLVISEYPPNVGVNRWQFVARNRIIAGISKALVVVEAKRKSGSLITAELALSENREVFIVGGNSFDDSYFGSNSLIQEGAKILLRVEEITEEYKVE